MNYSRLRISPHWNNFYCLSYTPNITDHTIQASLFIDGADPLVGEPEIHEVSNIPLESMSFSDSTNIMKTGGIYVYASERGTYPSIDDSASAIIAGTGSKTVIRVLQSSYKALSISNHPCLATHPAMTFVNFLNPDEPISYPYSKWTCLSKDHSNLVISRCNCSYHVFALPFELKGRYSACYDLNDLWDGRATAQEMIQRHRCVSEALLLVDDTKQSECRTKKALCSYTKYSVESFSTPWPITTFFEAIIKLFFDPRIAELEQAGLSPAGLKAFKRSFTTKSSNKALQVLVAREGLLSVIIEREKPTITFKEEIMAYPPSQLLSDCAGIFGVYLGVSVLSLCELLELLYNIIRSFVATKLEQKMWKNLSLSQTRSIRPTTE